MNVYTGTVFFIIRMRGGCALKGAVGKKIKILKEGQFKRPTKKNYIEGKIENIKEYKLGVFKGFTKIKIKKNIYI